MGPFVAILIALPLQALGYATTCTQGDSEAALVGSILSMPLLLLALVLLLLKRRSGSTARPMGILLCTLTLLTMLALTRDIWINTLTFGTPCGDGYQFYALGGGAWWLIVSAYLLVPTVGLVLCVGLGVRSLSRAAR